MKIMQVIPRLEIGGAERMCESLSSAFKELGHEVVIVSMFDYKTVINQNLEEKGIKIEYLHKHVGFDLSVKGKLKKLIKQYKPDVIHTHLNTLKYTAGVASKLLNQPIVHTVHNVAQKEAPEFDRKTNKKLYQSQKAVPVALTELVRQTIVEVYGLNENSIPTILNGSDVRRFVPKTYYEPQNGEICIINVAAFTQAKNHECSVETFAKLHQKYPNTRLMFAGTGDKMEAIKSMAEQLGVADSIDFFGSVDNIADVLSKSDIFILPSTYEGMPISIIEAMASGLPVVASRVGGVPDMIDDGKDGILIDPTVDSLYSALETLINDQALRENLGKQARIKSETMSSIAMAENYLKLYNQIINKDKQ